MTKRMVFDVESVGLHGEGFAYGYVLYEDGTEIGMGAVACPPTAARGDADDLKWVQENVRLPVNAVPVSTPREVRESFWQLWEGAKAEGFELWTDCGWPVEANFLSACIADDPQARKWAGPYPLLDVANIIKAAGRDPLATTPRLPSEEPAHDPLADARQSARLLFECFEVVDPNPRPACAG